MKLIYLTFIFFALLGCSSDDDSTSQDLQNATVLTLGIDCDNTWLIQFADDAPNIPVNSTNNIFYALNLPEEFETEGLTIAVQSRTPNDDESLVCTTLGPSYPQIYILSVE